MSVSSTSSVPNHDEAPLKSPAMEELRSILADLERLAQAYTRAGLLETGEAPRGAEGGGTAAPGGRPTGPFVPSGAEVRDESFRLRRALLLSGALLRNVVGGAILGAYRRRPAHATVFGGTQVGKSTTVNVLAGLPLARVHHTAGFTRHPQGFVPPAVDEATLFGDNPLSFEGFRQVAPTELTLERPDEYAVTRLTQTPHLPDLVLWDAPDCDAVGAYHYQKGLIEALTIADAVVYVTSREKYAINAILEWVVLLLEAGLPVAVCLNMTPAHQQRDILESMRDALAQVAGRHGVPDPAATAAALMPAAAFEYVPGGDVTLLYGADYEPGNRLRRAVKKLADASLAERPERARKSLAFIRRSVENVAAPALAELDAARLWEEEVGRALEAFAEDYRQNYLEDPNRYDAFNLVGIEILALLDPPIPGLSRSLTAVRRTLSVPGRLIAMGGRALWRMMTTHAQPQTSEAPRQETHSAEVQTFHQAHERLLNDLARTISQQQQASGRHRPFWDALDWAWEQNLSALQEDFRAELARHRERSEALVRQTARSIYDELAKDPVRLNVLRTGRITADAAAIIIAIKTGGVGVHDLVVTPALMSVVEAVSQALTENYVQHQRQSLKEKLLADTRAFADSVYGTRLRQVGRDALQDAGFLDLNAEAVRSLPARIDALGQYLGGGGGR